MTTEAPPETVAVLTRHRWLALRHHCASRAIDPAKLEASFDAIRAAFAPQRVDYSNSAYGLDHWKLSCFMEYSNGVATNRVDLAVGAPLLEVCRDILDECDRVFLPWWETLHPKPKTATRSLHRMQSFVTRYRPTPSDSHLPRHIDGANVDGSLVLGLPTYDAFGATGGLTVWDGENEAEEFVYPVAAGDAALLDSRVWHQSNAITKGERWVIVIFYEVRTTKQPRPPPAHAAPPAAGADGQQEQQQHNQQDSEASRTKAVRAARPARTCRPSPPTPPCTCTLPRACEHVLQVRGLLARRIKDAAKRHEVSAAALAPKTAADAKAAAAAWHGDASEAGPAAAARTT